MDRSTAHLSVTEGAPALPCTTKLIVIYLNWCRQNCIISLIVSVSFQPAPQDVNKVFPWEHFSTLQAEVQESQPWWGHLDSLKAKHQK